MSAVTEHTAIVDGHCHLGPAAAYHQPDHGAGDLVRTMDRLGVELACVFSTMGVRLSVREGNDRTLRAAARHPDRLIPFACVGGADRGAVREETDRALDLGCRGLKIHCSFLGLQLDDPMLEPALEAAHVQRLPVVSHGWPPDDRLAALADRYSGASIIIAHVGGRGLSRPVPIPLQVASVKDNVLLGTESSDVPLDGLAEVVDFVGADHLVYGSDFPWMSPAYQLGRFRSTPLTAAQTASILSGNMRRLLDGRP